MIEGIEDLSGISSFQLKYISSATLFAGIVKILAPFLYIIDSAILWTSFIFLFYFIFWDVTLAALELAAEARLALNSD